MTALQEDKHLFKINNRDNRIMSMDAALVSLMLALNRYLPTRFPHHPIGPIAASKIS